MVSKKIPKLFFSVLILALLFSVYFRFQDSGLGIPDDDEFYNFISAIKLNINHLKYDSRLYNYEHPFLGKKIMGLFIDKTANYSNIQQIPSNLYYYNYLAAQEIQGQESVMRFMLALFGVLALIPVFLIGKELYGNKTGLLTATLVGLSIGFINLSRVAYQDAFLPFFMLFAFYFIVRYIKSPEENKLFSKSNFYIALAGIFLLFSILIRVGQPIILVLALFVATIIKKNTKDAKQVVLVTILIAIAGIILYGVGPIEKTLELQGENIIPLGIQMNFLPGLISQGSLAFSILMLIGIFGFFTANKSIPILKKFKLWYDSLENEKNLLVVTMGLALLSIFLTAAGGSPRYYMVLTIFPILLVSDYFIRNANSFKYILVTLIILLDIGALFLVGPFFIDYTVLGLQPKYKDTDISDLLTSVKFIQEEDSGSQYLTNEEFLILRDRKAIPIPPRATYYKESKNCTKEYFESLKGTFILYVKGNADLDKDKWLCRELAEIKITFIKRISEKYEIYKIE